MGKKLEKFYIVLFYISCIIFFLVSFIFNDSVELGTNKELGNIYILLLPCILLYVYSLKLDNENRKKYIKYYFISYLLILINFCFSNARYAFGNYNLILNDYYNVIPFSSIKELLTSEYGLGYGLYNILGNFLMLTPLAILLPLLFKKYKKNIRFIFTILLISILIEGLQLFIGKGCFDIDDIILNTSGAIIVYFIFKIKLVDKFVNYLLFELTYKGKIINYIILIITILSTIYSIYRIGHDIFENTLIFSDLHCENNEKTLIGSKDNYYYYTKCKYSGEIKQGYMHYDIYDYLQSNYNPIYDKKLGITKEKIISDIKVTTNNNKLKLIYESCEIRKYFYGIDKIEMKKDDIIYDLEEDIKGEHQLNYLDVLNQIVYMDRNRNRMFDIYKSDDFNVLKCYKDRFSFNEFIVAPNIKLDNDSCEYFNNLIK